MADDKIKKQETEEQGSWLDWPVTRISTVVIAVGATLAAARNAISEAFFKR